MTAPLSAQVWHKPSDAGTAQTVALLCQKIAEQTLIPAVKYLVSQRYHDGAWERLLPPLIELSEAEKQALREVDDLLATWGKITQ